MSSGNMTAVASRRNWVLLGRGAGARCLVVAITFDEGLANPEMAAFLEYDRTATPGSDHRRFPSLEAAVRTVLDALARNTPTDFANSPLSVLYRLQYGIARTNSVVTASSHRSGTTSSNLEQDTESRNDETSNPGPDHQTSDTSRSTDTSGIGNVNNIMAGQQLGLPASIQDVDLMAIGTWVVDSPGIDGMDLSADLDLDI